MPVPDFEVNEGYVEAGRRRADSPLSSRVSAAEDKRTPTDGYGAIEEGGFALAPGIRAEGADALETGDSAGTVDGPRALPERTPIVRRTRHLATGHFVATDMPTARRVGVELIARRRRLARRACPYGWQVRVLGRPPRNRRCLWTTCHRSPESLS